MENKNTQNTWIIGGLIAVVVLVGGYFLLKPSQESTQVNQSTTYQSESPTTSSKETSAAAIAPPAGFVDKITFTTNGKSYSYGPIPAHFWQKKSDTEILGVQYNGDKPFAWATDVSADTKLYDVEGQLGTCRNGYQKDKPTQAGFVHFHASNEDKNVGWWLKHTTVASFTWQGPPGNPDIGRKVTVGVDDKFPNICEGGPA